MFRASMMFCVLGCASATSAIDTFDRHTTVWLREAVKDQQPTNDVSAGQAAGWKLIDPRIGAPCMVLKTNNGHWTKALLSWGLRKNGGKTLPVLVIDRYVTYDNERLDVALAAGKNVMLFPGFYFNFEIGQVVPEGQGGDVVFTETRKLRSVDKAQMYGLNGSALPASTAENLDPLDHEGVLPRDFSGSWQINADGRWTGVWQLTVESGGSIQGTYQSDESKSVYRVTGQVTGAPHRATLEIELANAVQSFEALLWTKDKSTMAGTTVLADRKFGFFAQRMKTDRR